MFSKSQKSPQVFPSAEIVKGELYGQEGVPARVHSECFTGDVLASKRCDCGQQLHKFMQVMNGVPIAILLYIKGQEGRGIGLLAKIRAYQLQDQGHDTVDANLKLGLPVDIRTYGDALFVLRDLGSLDGRVKVSTKPELLNSDLRGALEIFGLGNWFRVRLWELTGRWRKVGY
eukprot:s1158_g5.t1